MKYLRLFLIAILISAFGFVMVQADWETRGISDNYDDLMMTTTGGVFQLSPWVQVKSGGTDLFNYYAFRSLSIPNNSVIDVAYLEFTAPFPWNYNQSLPVTIYGLKQGDLSSWNPVPDLGGMAKTDALTNWDTYDLISGHSINVTVTSIVQEIYDQFTWEDGNDMGFQVVSIAVSGGERYQVAYDSDSTKAVKLYVEYSEGTVGSEYWYKGYKIQNVTAGTAMTFDWWDTTSGYQRVTSIQGKDYETHNLTGDLYISPDNVVSVGEDIYMVWVDETPPTNKSLMRSSDRGATWTSMGEFEDNGGVFANAICNALAYDEAGTIHIASTLGYDTTYLNYTISSGNYSAMTLIYDGGQNAHEVRALWDEVHDTIWFTRYGGVGVQVLRQPTVIRRHNGVWETFTNTDDLATGKRQSDLTWANNRMYWIIHDYQLAPASQRLNAYELDNYNDLTSWVPIGDQAYPQYVGGAGSTGTISFDVGTTASGFLAVSQERTIGGAEYVVQYRWNTVGKTWTQNTFNLTGFQPASQPQFHFPKMFYDLEDVLNMGIIVQQDSGNSLIYNTWVHYQSWEPTPPNIVAKATTHNIWILGGDMNPYSEADYWNVTTPPNGTDPNPACLALAITLEDVQACIDDVTGGGDPFDPDPPASNYPDHENFGRFDIKYYIWIIGQVCIIAPCVAIAYRRFPYLYYPMFAITVIVGLGLLWSLSGM